MIDKVRQAWLLVRGKLQAHGQFVFHISQCT